ncbi:hypothetical protein HRR83_000514 [Exophiala dermatitidis]|uniref:F-box domain-containing protein n=1 Tax=Exophiala dermatitidis TaxID=5970 RepID=A0AAN6IYV8_EXODE|nr:hypothetical protein HRR75_000467 [Exophiala dermatitidis]KAJ4527760.1 hypothetical protein HRR74_000515 [Exophiala dermatitidis]KAJ4528396.1 hypothetical protein HRR73_001019 [Exophiala dermatitidis]KAJ4531352.1 hypothetical protein HRR76_009013 [Exophiala dermatitidis]KAJ4558514.1 hypothetical protein HRR77_000515 [Exophiala dermatitidis]
MKDTGTANTGSATRQIDQNHHECNLLLDLPNELILTVASFLELEYQLVLSFSCRRLHGLLNPRLDLTFKDDKNAKVRFMQLLERDHPQYLTCRSCARLYLWPMTELFQYNCQRAYEHLVADILFQCDQLFQAGDDKSIRLTRGVVDLILRDYEHGPLCGFGLPVSLLNMSGQDHDGVSRTHEARLVDGQLILASRMEVEAESGEEMLAMRRFMTPDVCLHLITTGQLINEIWQTFEQALASMRLGADKFDVFKCPFCETDHQLHIKKTTKNLARIVLDVWRNYGRRYENRLSTEQIFHRNPVLRLDADSISQRDVRAVFESAKECTPDMDT